MRAWLIAKAEEDKRKQEEERTRQESLRLEQRRMEHDILRTSLQGGIPPPMVPVVFAGMAGGVLPQATLEWAQQYIYSQTQHSQPPALLPPGGPSSPDHHRRGLATAVIPSVCRIWRCAVNPGSAQGPPPSSYMQGFPGSPTRPRGQSMPGQPPGRPGGAGGGVLPNLNTGITDSRRGGFGSATRASRNCLGPATGTSAFAFDIFPPLAAAYEFGRTGQL